MTVYTTNPNEVKETNTQPEIPTQAPHYASFSMPPASERSGDSLNPHIGTENDNKGYKCEISDYDSWLQNCFNEWEKWLIDEELRLAQKAPQLNPSRKYKPTTWN